MKELERQLREGAEKVSAGKIRIDSKRALQRLRDFRFADPSHWILEVLRAAVESGARTVEVETDADDVIVTFGGSPFDGKALDGLLERALEPGTTDDERRTRLLALGVAGALGAGAAFVTVQTDGKKLTLQGEDVRVTDDDDAPKDKRTRVHLHKAFGWRVVTGLLRGSPESRAVKDRVQRFPAKLTLDGKLLPSVQRVAKSASTFSEIHRGDGWVLELDFDPDAPLRHTTLWLEVSGVTVSHRLLALPGVQFTAWLSSSELRRNASGSDVIDEDESLVAATKKLEGRSLAALSNKLNELCKLPKWRSKLAVMLAQANEESTTTAHQVRTTLKKAPLLPGPAGEFLSVAELEVAKNKNGAIHFATETFPKGSYPEPTVLLRAGDHESERLIPEGKRVDVEKLVRQKRRVAEARADFEAREVVTATLGDWHHWTIKGAITGANVTGEVGLDERERGAFIKVLVEGRPFYSAEAPTLAPLRMRAIVDWQRKLADTYFEESGDQRLFALVLRVVEEAAVNAICRALVAGEKRDDVFPHAMDLLGRFANRAAKRGEIPQALRAAPLFDVIGGARLRASLDELDGWKRWPFVFGDREHALLSGEPVLHLDAAAHALLKRLGGKRLDDVSGQLDSEAGIRRRMSGPREVPAVRDAYVAVVAIGDESLKGEVALPKEASNKLTLTVIRDGFRLETTQLSARYGASRAVVESSAVTPNDGWTTVKRDQAWQAILTAVQDAERRLAAELVKQPRAQWGANGEAYLQQYLARELRRFDLAKLDDVDRAVVEAPLFDAGKRRVSLLELSKQQRLLARGKYGPAIPDGVLVVVEPQEVVELLSEALGRPFEDAGPELERLEVRRQLEALPQLPFELMPSSPLAVRLTGDNWTGLAGLRDGTAASSRVELRVDGRAYTTLQRYSAMPMGVVMEMPALSLTASRVLSMEDSERVAAALEVATGQLVSEALKRLSRSSDDAVARRALLLAVGKRVDGSISSKLTAEAMRKAPIFPCTDGKLRSVDQLESPTQYVRSPMKGLLPNKKPIVVADDEVIRAGLERFVNLIGVDDALKLQVEAEQKRSSIAAVEVKSRVESWWRARVDESGITGEVVVPLTRGGVLELFYEKKPLVTLEGVLPGSLSAAIDSPRLRPKPGFTGVEQDDGLAEVISVVSNYASRLGALIEAQPIPPGWAPAAVRLAFQLAGESSWEWKGKKKGKKKKGGEKSEPAVHSLLRKPLLRTNDGETMSVKDLLDAQLEDGKVAITKRGGSFLDARRVWWPRDGEEAMGLALALKLDDVSAELELADRVRALPVFAKVEVPMQSPWRAAVRGAGLEGEVVLFESPAPQLVVEVLSSGRLLERWVTDHPVGGQGRVQSARVTPDLAFTAAKRDANFKELMSSTEAALERAVVDRLKGFVQTSRENGHTGGVTPFLRAVMKWKRDGGGPIFAALAVLPLFHTLDGATLTVGQVIELGVKQGKVPVAEQVPGAAPDQQVLVYDESTRLALEALGLKFEIVTGELLRKTELQQSLTNRRLESLSWKGDALLRLPLSGALRGELALTRGEALSTARSHEAHITLARDGIPVGEFDRPTSEETPLKVVGVVALTDLQVNETWTRATLTRGQKEAIGEQIDALFGLLAKEAGGWSDLDRERAATTALAWLLTDSGGGRVSFEQLKGAHRAVARAPLFLTGEGLKVSLEQLASSASKSGKVAVFARGLPAPKAEVLVCAHDAGWIGALETALGKNKVWRVTSRSEWEQAAREADPESGSPLAQGLESLRKHVRLLRSGALGRLTPEDLEDVKLSRDGGRASMRYDARRKLVLLDPDHPHVKRALSEVNAYPERLWLLLAAIFGAVNRALDHVTDEHEAQLALAMAAHLAANPKLLEPTK